MEKQLERQIKMYDGKVFGIEVSEYGLKNGYLDYYTLSRIVGEGVLNNRIFRYVGYENWELVNGEEENEYGEYLEVYQYYIIPGRGYTFLKDYTDELVYYNEELGLYLWGITHFGTSWGYVLTDIKLV